MTAKIKLNSASGGGSVSIQAPSSMSNNRIITLPDLADGTLVTSQSSLDSTKLAGVIPANQSSLIKITDGSWTSAVSSVAVDNLDTSTYKYFKMLWNHIPTDQGRRLSFRWRVGGSDQTAGAYDWNFGRYYGAGTNYIAENADKVEVTDDMGDDGWEGCQLEFTIYPQGTAENGYHGNAVFWNGIFHENATYVRGVSGSAFYDGGTGTHPDGFKLYMNVGNMDSGNYAVYGIKR